MKPKILIVGEDGFAMDTGHYVLNLAYARAITEAGGLPLLAFDWNSAAEYLDIADGLFLTGLAALDRLVHGNADGVAGFRSRQDTLYAGKILGGLEDLGLLDRSSLHVALGIELRQNGVHAVIAQTTCMVRCGNIVAAERIHLLQRAYPAGVAIIVGIAPAREGGAAGGFDGDEPVVVFAAQLFAHERSDEPCEI